MELLQLKYFKALAETEHLTRTADRLFVSAPALSCAIKRLESELGTTLFDRVGRRMHLNECGSIYLQCVNQVFSALNNAERQITDIGISRNPTISICVTSPIIWQNLFCAFMKSFPNITLSHYYVNIEPTLVEDMEIKYDYLLTPPTDLKNNKLHSNILYSDDIPMLIVNKSHRFANRDKIKLSEVKDEPFIALTKGLSSRKFFDELFAIAGIEPKIILECDYSMRQEMILSGNGIALSTARARKSNLMPDVRFIEVIDPHFRRSQALFWHSNRFQTSTSLLFREFAIEYYNDDSNAITSINS